VAQARVIYFGLAAIYLVVVVVQFFLAGLGVFGATDFDAHRVVGFILGIGSIVLLLVAVIGRMPRSIALATVLLLGLNVLQIVLVNIDVEEIEALHLVNAVVIVFTAYELMQRSRRHLGDTIERGQAAPRV
jgi:hypothetical protein